MYVGVLCVCVCVSNISSYEVSESKHAQQSRTLTIITLYLLWILCVGACACAFQCVCVFVGYTIYAELTLSAVLSALTFSLSPVKLRPERKQKQASTCRPKHTRSLHREAVREKDWHTVGNTLTPLLHPCLSSSLTAT